MDNTIPKYLDTPLDPELAIMTLVQGVSPKNLTSNRLEEEYPKLIEYLAEQYGVETEEEVLQEMAKTATYFWSILPGESVAEYKLFIYLMQLPYSHRSITNAIRLQEMVERGANPDFVLQKDFMLYHPMVPSDKFFWKLRADMFDQYLLEKTVQKLGENRETQLALLSQQAISLSQLGVNTAITLLTACAKKLATMDIEEMGVREAIAGVKVAGLMADQAVNMAAAAYNIEETMEALNQLREHNRIVEAKKI